VPATSLVDQVRQNVVAGVERADKMNPGPSRRHLEEAVQNRALAVIVRAARKTKRPARSPKTTTQGKLDLANIGNYAAQHASRRNHHATQG